MAVRVENQNHQCLPALVRRYGSSTPQAPPCRAEAPSEGGCCTAPTCRAVVGRRRESDEGGSRTKAGVGRRRESDGGGSRTQAGPILPLAPPARRAEVRRRRVLVLVAALPPRPAGD